MSTTTQPDEAISDRIHIALTLDSTYAMPAAVTVRGIAENVQGPVTIYIYDCGLLEEEKKKIEASLPERADLTLRYMALPPDGLGIKLGAAWARVDMMKTLPLNRVLYVDADTLVRKDLRELWNIDLKGHALGVVPDPWMPAGHDGVRTPRGQYFNSGVLLIDLVEVRPTIPALEKLCCRMKGTTPFRDQDPLNVHFRCHTTPLSDRWNAIGYGTALPDEERAKRFLVEAKDPAIVHFIGPAHPPALYVLTVPEYQPCSTKPWGYVGARGHPYAEEWWDMLEKTAWKGYRGTTEYKETCERAKMKTWKLVEEEFERRIGLKRRS